MAGCRADFDEFGRIDIRTWGDIVYSEALKISQKVNDELLIPMSEWIDDPDWIKKFQYIEDRVPTWAAYKKNQRLRMKRSRILLQERLKNYWRDIRRKRNYRKEISKLFGRKIQSQGKKANLDNGFISPIITPFSQPERRKAETIQKFMQASRLSLSGRLPWKLMISSELTEEKSFGDLRVYCADKEDKISKFIHLLDMEVEGEIKIIQDDPFGEIRIAPLNIACNQKIKIKDRQTMEYIFEWNQLSANQQARIVADIKANKIICRAFGGDDA